jgi:hypothetical protein
MGKRRDKLVAFDIRGNTATRWPGRGGCRPPSTATPTPSTTPSTVQWRLTTGTQGTTASLAGRIVADRPAPRFTATLLKEEGQWRLVSLRLADGVGALAPAGTGRAPVR